MNRRELARLIDHTALGPEVTQGRIDGLCGEAKEFGFATVCVSPIWVPHCREMLEGSDVGLCTVVGFPHGAHRTGMKVMEAEFAMGTGATELDMVISVGHLKGGDLDYVQEDIAAVVAAATRPGTPPALVKVIIETCLLNPGQIVQACQLARDAGAHFVKTSTGFGKVGATVDNVRLMRQTVGDGLGVKAAGGIRDLPTALSMLDAGATRLGCSASVAIVMAADPA